MNDNTMRLQGWYKLMTAKPARARKISERQRKVEEARWNKIADEAEAWAAAIQQEALIQGRYEGAINHAANLGKFDDWK